MSWMREAASFGVLAASCLVGGCASTGGVPPFWEHETGLPGDTEERRWLFGLVRERAAAAGATELVVQPLFVRNEAADGGVTWNVLPPFGHRRENQSEVTSTIWPLFFRSARGSPQEREDHDSDDDTALFPLLLWGHEPNEGSYFLLFPLGGNLKGKLVSEEIRMGLFPLWVRTRAGSWTSTHLLWPLIAWGTGDGRSHFRVLPFWSQSDGATGSRRSALWPLVHWSHETVGEREFDGWMVFPFVGRKTARDGTSEQWTVLYPFFHSAEDSTNGYAEWGAPWPFLVGETRPGADGKGGSEMRWWWPLYGRFDSPDEVSRFWLWPIGWHRDVRRGSMHTKMSAIVPFWMQTERTPADGGPGSESVRGWPLFSWDRDADGLERVRVPEILPFFGWDLGEAVYADLLSLYRRRSDAEGRVAWDGPFGIVRYRRDVAGASRLTLLWWLTLPLGGGS